MYKHHFYLSSNFCQDKNKFWLSLAEDLDRRAELKKQRPLPIPPAFGHPIVKDCNIIGIRVLCPWCRKYHDVKCDGDDGHVSLVECGKFVKYFFDDKRHSVSNYAGCLEKLDASYKF